jgi:hypothetical protein
MEKCYKCKYFQSANGFREHYCDSYCKYLKRSILYIDIDILENCPYFKERLLSKLFGFMN